MTTKKATTIARMPAINPRLAAIAVTVGSDFDASVLMGIFLVVASALSVLVGMAIEGSSEVLIVTGELVVAMTVGVSVVTIGVSVVVVLVGTSE